MAKCIFEKEFVENENKEKQFYYSLTLTEDEYNVISKLFPGNHSEIITTAVDEFLDFIKQPKKFSKFSAFQEYRLYLLIKNLFQDNFVSEANVKRIFKIDSTPAKKMISNVKIDYEDELKKFSKNSMHNFIESIEENDDSGRYLFTCKSQTMIDSLNLLLQEKQPDSRKIEKERGSLCTYHIYIDEFNFLKKELQ